MSDGHHDHEHEHEPVGYGTYFLTWFSLLMLTAVTVTVAGYALGNWSVWVALIIASVKASVVLYLFMHLKYEKQLFHTMLIIILVTLIIFIGLTFTDTLFR